MRDRVDYDTQVRLFRNRLHSHLESILTDFDNTFGVILYSTDSEDE